MARLRQKELVSKSKLFCDCIVETQLKSVPELKEYRLKKRKYGWCFDLREDERLKAILVKFGVYGPSDGETFYATLTVSGGISYQAMAIARGREWEPSGDSLDLEEDFWPAEPDARSKYWGLSFDATPEMILDTADSIYATLLEVGLPWLRTYDNVSRARESYIAKEQFFNATLASVALGETDEASRHFAKVIAKRRGKPTLVAWAESHGLRPQDFI